VDASPRIVTHARASWPRVAAAIALIVVATFPFDFMSHAHWRRVAWVPFLTGTVKPIDLLVNAALYIPLGLWIPIGSRRARLTTTFLTALTLSVALESAQVWSHVRFPSATDAVMNVWGAMFGGWLRQRDHGVADDERRRFN
jgi:glycopeptide antibiotics resistance protein